MSFKFDNAFLTSKNAVGIQFVDRSIKDVDGKYRTCTIYPNEKKILVADCTVKTLSNEEYVKLVQEYNKRHQWYMPKKAS